MAYTLDELYESLKGCRSQNGELVIPDFTDADYEDLYYAILDSLKDEFGTNYPGWYKIWAYRYHRHRQNNSKTYEFADPPYDLPLEQQTIRNQLVVLKFFIGRRYWHRKTSMYWKGEDDYGTAG
ncbi:hypothetical protein [Alicyclobacillus kakegawensis]|uniref:hypothetical protein n=1 Tax=Alicyclobacillus kakegawensis TaxID=392012 RepID=UPI00082A125F|nr:hypothetical protein [Alicyclobacillus kakegawensis]